MRQHAQGHRRALNRSRGGGAFLKQSVLTIQGSAGAACRLLVGLHHTPSRAGMRCRPRPSIVDVLALARRYACIEHVQFTWCPFGIDFSSLHFAVRRHVNPLSPRSQISARAAHQVMVAPFVDGPSVSASNTAIRMPSGGAVPGPTTLNTLNSHSVFLHPCKGQLFGNTDADYY